MPPFGGRDRRCGGGRSRITRSSAASSLASPAREFVRIRIYPAACSGVHRGPTQRTPFSGFATRCPRAGCRRSPVTNRRTRERVPEEERHDGWSLGCTWVLLTEAAEGGWGIAGTAFGREELAALAAKKK